jgi:hypothetical protein
MLRAASFLIGAVRGMSPLPDNDLVLREQVTVVGGSGICVTAEATWFTSPLTPSMGRSSGSPAVPEERAG